MALTLDSVSLKPIAAPIAAQAPAAPAIAAVGERAGANNDRRDSQRNDRGRPSVAFRSFLNAATLAGLTQTLSKDTVVVSSDEPPPRQTKVPEQEPTTISSEEADHLYQSAQTASEAQPRRETARVRAYQAATSRYATSFFSVSGTFARPGESLEVTA